MEIQDKGYDLPIDEKKKKEVVNDCEENMEAIRDIYSEFNGMQEDQNICRQMMDRMKEIINKMEIRQGVQNHLFCYGNYQKMENVFECRQARRKRQRNFI